MPAKKTDTNNDGEISRKEHEAAIHSVLTDAGKLEACVARIEKMFGIK